MTETRRPPRLSPWARAVVVSAVLVLGSSLALGIWTVASRHREVATFAVRGQIEGVALDVDDADVDIVRGTGRLSVGVQRTDRFTFDHRARVERSVRDGVFRLRSRCPETVLRSCRVRFGLTVPDNVPVTVRTDKGRVRLTGYRGSAKVTTNSGAIHVDAFCGFSLEARAESGDIDAVTSCPLQQLSLRSTSGDVRAAVPPGRYEVEADSAGGSRAVHGIEAAPDAPFSIQALSSSGDVRVEGGP